MAIGVSFADSCPASRWLAFHHQKSIDTNDTQLNRECLLSAIATQIGRPTSRNNSLLTDHKNRWKQRDEKGENHYPGNGFLMLFKKVVHGI